MEGQFIYTKIVGHFMKFRVNSSYKGIYITI